MRFGSGIAVVLGALLFIYSMLVVRREVVKPGPVVKDAAVPKE
jgi:nitric oxide reductase subunit B